MKRLTLPTVLSLLLGAPYAVAQASYDAMNGELHVLHSENAVLAIMDSVEGVSGVLLNQGAAGEVPSTQVARFTDSSALVIGYESALDVSAKSTLDVAIDALLANEDTTLVEYWSYDRMDTHFLRDIYPDDVDWDALLAGHSSPVSIEAVVVESRGNGSELMLELYSDSTTSFHTIPLSN